MVIDLGTARKFRDGQMGTTVVGTPLFMAKEVKEGLYNMELADVHGVAVTMLVMAVGAWPNKSTMDETLEWFDLFNVEYVLKNYQDPKHHNHKLVKVARNMIYGISERSDMLDALEMLDEARPSDAASNKLFAPHQFTFTKCYREIAKSNGLAFLRDAINVGATASPTSVSKAYQRLQEKYTKQKAQLAAMQALLDGTLEHTPVPAVVSDDDDSDDGYLNADELD